MLTFLFEWLLGLISRYLFLDMVVCKLRLLSWVVIHRFFYTVFQSEEYNCIFIQITTPGCECLSPTSSLPLQGVAFIALYLCADCVLLHLLASVIAYAPLHGWRVIPLLLKVGSTARTAHWWSVIGWEVEPRRRVRPVANCWSPQHWTSFSVSDYWLVNTWWKRCPILPSSCETHVGSKCLRIKPLPMLQRWILTRMAANYHC